MDFSFGHFPVDLILFALVAAFLALRLRSVLGKRVGFQPSPMPVPPRPQAAGKVIDGKAEQIEPAAYDIPAQGTRVGQLLQDVRGLDNTFTPQQFLSGVQTAFPQVVKAFAEGDHATLKTRLTPAVCESFEAAMAARDAAGEKQRSEIKAIRSLAIEDVRLVRLDVGTGASIDVRIVSDQISLLTDAQGQPVTGTDAVTEFSDLWTFERLLGVNGSVWRLASARSA
ncbi:Tim44/TimA family putative adaptor protein [Acetobacter orleanensis]|uniref:Calcium-binding protein n=1 Tax=Acetobacter orleanensis TaxID=104099 RepID=A0A4Y3TM12_9PROT|nr:Tim44/TimA family putative adaptor protein [Acetobacter orleanensis]KXV62823.1 preprotein translocase subunit Tim44 [Acetobacter orleanensis]PCD80599.1 Tim44 domain-containing protein [Acetobacter orleanensis]GAN68077.1 mitochondrial import inner membrane translocase subunit Tim44 [Acetobacter orleanensis JCM 7639]GBR27116.1 mitochondrial import inner membrane translocase subunit Tim44 [Acetobacter orleanensis NRIC 0473]GEB82000.1 calcium-binding protein [Acetobacter orleanensis]